MLEPVLAAPVYIWVAPQLNVGRFLLSVVASEIPKVQLGGEAPGLAGSIAMGPAVMPEPGVITMGQATELLGPVIRQL